MRRATRFLLHRPRGATRVKTIYAFTYILLVTAPFPPRATTEREGDKLNLSLILYKDVRQMGDSFFLCDVFYWLLYYNTIARISIVFLPAQVHAREI